MNPTSPIVLTTDFGLSDYYVGVMKGVILSINPNANIIDLTHYVPPQNIRQAAFILGVNHKFFPAGAIQVAVVDPGVGTQRRAILLITPDARFLAPDNGLLSHVLREYVKQPPDEPGDIQVPSQCSAYQLTAPQFWVQPLSSTFHARDVFAPVAAHLSNGILPSELGVRVQELQWLPCPVPVWLDGMATGEVIYIDHFGNLVTNFMASDLPDPTVLTVEVRTHRISGINHTFHNQDDSSDASLIALVGSHRYLEIAVPDGNAASKLGMAVGEPVRVIWETSA